MQKKNGIILLMSLLFLISFIPISCAPDAKGDLADDAKLEFANSKNDLSFYDDAKVKLNVKSEDILLEFHENSLVTKKPTSKEFDGYTKVDYGDVWYEIRNEGKLIKEYIKLTKDFKDGKKIKNKLKFKIDIPEGYSLREDSQGNYHVVKDLSFGYTLGKFRAPVAWDINGDEIDAWFEKKGDYLYVVLDEERLTTALEMPDGFYVIVDPTWEEASISDFILGTWNLVEFKPPQTYLTATRNMSLPNYGATNAYANMTGNVLLAHLNNDSSYGENDTHIYDFSGSGHNGNLTGGSAPYTSSGKFSGARTFEGVGGGYLSFSNNADYTFSENDNFTLSSWAKGGGYTWGKSDTADGYFIYFRQGYIWTVIRNSTDECGGTNFAEAAYEGSRWYHVVLAYNASTHNSTQYVNGIKVTEHDCSGVTGFNYTGAVQIGGVGGYRFTGTIDEVAIWNRTLSDSEVYNLYNSTSALYFPEASYTSTSTNATDVQQWGILTVTKSNEDENHYITIDIIDNTTGNEITGYTGLTASTIDLSGIEIQDYRNIKVRANFYSDGSDSARLSGLSLSWTEELVESSLSDVITFLILFAIAVLPVIFFLGALAQRGSGGDYFWAIILMIIGMMAFVILMSLSSIIGFVD